METINIVQVCGEPKRDLFASLVALWGVDSLVVQSYSEHGCHVTTVSDKDVKERQDVILSAGTEALEVKYPGGSPDGVLPAPVTFTEGEVHYSYWGYIEGMDPENPSVVYVP